MNRNFTNQSGNREADFINCVIWRKSAETLANYARKGTLLGVTGRIQTRNYENQQGQRVYVTEVVAENFQLLESRTASEQRQQNPSSDDSFQGGEIILTTIIINPLSQLRTLCLTSIEIQIHLVGPPSTFQMMIYHSNN